MKTWIDEKSGCKMCDPDCVDEWLFDIWAIGCDYDGYHTAEDLKDLIDELVAMANKARDCLWDGKLFGIHGQPETPSGYWIGEGDGYADGELVYDVWYCSECNYCIDDGTDDPEMLPNYCPNCGMKMER